MVLQSFRCLSECRIYKIAALVLSCFCQKEEEKKLFWPQPADDKCTEMFEKQTTQALDGPSRKTRAEVG